MERLVDYLGSTLEWVQPKALVRTFELRSGEVQLATLTFRSAWGTLAAAETAEEAWTFKRVGFINTRVTVRPAGSEEEIGLYTLRFAGGGTLVMAGGPTLTWVQTNFWATHWAFVDPNKNPVVSFTAGREKGGLADIFKSQARLEVEPATAYRDWLPLLATLGMYLVVLQTEDAAAMGAVL